MDISPVEVPNSCRKGWASANKHPPGEALPFACKPPIGEYSEQIGNTVFPKDSPTTYVKGNDATAEAVCFDHGLVFKRKMVSIRVTHRVV